ncbi:alanine--glyoxylate aminotransferase family protein [Alginatibacterium sediminis]|uniref:Alanine--glyoxylate aminotransferase family protein n=1 Tax=Alginatibacterium sediminis TaxID=2164068 RepID=A0A420EKV4_9ALTE|nr:alanine--glyoxylate aminotransferase family protein [Alginatibacterium sediminis]RKF21313.1 alanine--glyoxylate aminotransferase family protein [Alginatibacterium sediminis]
MTYTSFFPQQRTLMGPGPSDISPQVQLASSKPLVGHLDPQFLKLMDEIKQMLQLAFQTQNANTFVVSAPGSAGMETCFVNLLEPGDKVIVCINGVFGMRMKENIERCQAQAIVVEDPWGSPVSEDKLELALQQHPDAKCVAFVHAETSTGVCSDAQALCAIAKRYNCLTIVDAVTSLGGVPLKVDEWQIDAVYSGSQKCLSCIPGLSPVSFSPAAIDVLNARKVPVQSWFLDHTLVMNYWSSTQKRSYHHTAPVTSLYAMHEALVQLHHEGLENSWNRHQQQHMVLRDGLEAMGIEFIVDPKYRLPQLNTVAIPNGVDDALIRSRLLNEYNLEIGAGLGAFAGKAWRIGLMGYAARTENVSLCLAALREVL